MESNWELLINQKLNAGLFKGSFGLEVEEHRVDYLKKRISFLAHPKNLGDRKTQPYFQTDFSESQEELVTTPFHTTQACLKQLHELQAILHLELQPSESIWPLSMPPVLNQTSRDYVTASFSLRPWHQKYLRAMLKKDGCDIFYGTISGIHVNYAPDPKLVSWFQKRHKIAEVASAKNQLLFQIAQHVLGYRWLLTYLFGAAPFNENKSAQHSLAPLPPQPVRSWRSSKKGFNNLNFEPDYSSFTNFNNQLAHYLKTGTLINPNSFHGPIRFKGAHNNNNFKYIEFRLFDFNPLSLNGIDQMTLSFLHLLIIDAQLHPKTWDHNTLDTATALNDQIALQHPATTLNPAIKNKIRALLTRFTRIIEKAPQTLKPDFKKVLAFIKKALNDPLQTLSGQLIRFTKNESLMEFGFTQGQRIKKFYQKEPYNLKFPEVAPENLAAHLQAYKLGK